VELDAKVAAARALLAGITSGHAPAVFTTSFGAEDMVITDLIADGNIDIDIVSIDTGRLPAETYELMARTARRYPQQRIDVLFPDHQGVEAFVAQHGVNGFYDSVDARKACCAARKLEPLRRALAGRNAWVTGLRRAQSVTREGLGESEYDEQYRLTKFNPLLEWSERDVWDYLRARDVPYNTLHDQHYPSIGCAPCTRAIAVGEDVRAGRWWWENPENKECGLHVHMLKPAA